MATNNKVKITCTVDKKVEGEVREISTEVGEPFSSVINNCIKLGLPEYKYFNELQKKVLKQREQEMKERTINELKKVSNEDSPQRSPSSEVVTSSDISKTHKGVVND